MRDLTLTPRDRRRLTYGLLFSLTLHVMLLHMVILGQGFGLPGFSFPWQDRRTEVPDLHLILLPAPVPAAEPLASAGVEPPGDAEPGVMKLVDLAPSPSAPQASPDQAGEAKTVAASSSATAISPLPVEPPNEKSVLPPKSTEDLITMAKPHESTWTVPPAPEIPAPATAIAIPPLPNAADVKQDTQREAEQLEAERQEVAKQAAAQQEAARQEAIRQEAARAEAARVEAERQEAAKQAAAQQDAARQEAIRQEAVRADAARVEAERQAAAKQAAAQQEAARQEATRQEVVRADAARVEAERQAAAKQAAAQQEAARQETARQEAVRADAARVEAERQEAAKKAAAQQQVAQEAARAETARAEAERKEASRQEAVRQAAAQQEAVRQEATRAEAARSAALQAEEEKRQEKLRAIGRQLNEEANRREAAQRQFPSASGARRGRLLGLTDSNAELILYAEAWSRKVTQNMTFDMVREAAKQPHTNPMVTVAIRSDGSVESVSFVVSSGVPDIDEAIRRIVYSQANYQAFSPGLAKDFDVIEIRRTWYFDMAIRLY